MGPTFALCALLAGTHALRVPGGTIEVSFLDGGFDLPEAALTSWVESSARAVAAYLGSFPVPRAEVRVHTRPGSGVVTGTAYRSHVVDVQVGRRVTRAELSGDWVMTHELVHLGFPTLEERHHWMEEGLATYVEPLGRLRTGGLTIEKVWGDLVAGLPNGLPRSGDRGLDFTPTWGRTYWGGALFWLLADIEIHSRTGNRKGIEHALRAIVAAGGTIDASWSVDQVIAIGDRATGVPVLRELYDQMKDRPHPVDLDALWKRLGVVAREGRISFDDSAPQAGIRRAITR